MTPRLRPFAPLLLVVGCAPSAPAQTPPPVDAATPAQANDARARQGRFQNPPPPVPPAPLPAAGQPPTNTNTAVPRQPQQRRQWRELTDALLDLMAPRALMADELLVDPLTTGFGNSDFVEPLLVFDAAHGDAATSAKKPEF